MSRWPAAIEVISISNDNSKKHVTPVVPAASDQDEEERPQRRRTRFSEDDDVVGNDDGESAERSKPPALTRISLGGAARRSQPSALSLSRARRHRSTVHVDVDGSQESALDDVCDSVESEAVLKFENLDCEPATPSSMAAGTASPSIRPCASSNVLDAQNWGASTCLTNEVEGDSAHVSPEIERLFLGLLSRHTAKPVGYVGPHGSPRRYDTSIQSLEGGLSIQSATSLYSSSEPSQSGRHIEILLPSASPAHRPRIPAAIRRRFLPQYVSSLSTSDKLPLISDATREEFPAAACGLLWPPPSPQGLPQLPRSPRAAPQERAAFSISIS